MLRIIFFVYKMFFQIDSRSILAYGHKLPIFVLNRGLPKKNDTNLSAQGSRYNRRVNLDGTYSQNPPILCARAEKLRGKEPD
jgi:hypothetical protein